MQWELLRGNTGVITTRMALIPTCRVSAGEVVLIDSGAEEEPELISMLDAQGVRVAAVICTHLHPDHIANNRALARRYGTRIYAPAGEIAAAEGRFSDLKKNEPGHIWADLGPDYPVTPLTGGKMEIAGADFVILPTPGHTADHAAVITPDNVCCLGDAMMSAGRIERAKLPYMDDADLAVESLEKLRGTDCDLYIAAHRGLVEREDLDAVIDANIRKELELYDLLRRTVDRPMEQSAAVEAFMAAAGVTGREKNVNVFMRHTARVRIQALINAGELRREGNCICPNGT